MSKDFALGDLGQRLVHRGPFPPRTAFDVIANGCKQLFRPVAQRAPDDRVGLVLSEFGPQGPHHRHQHLGLDAGLVQERQFRIYQILVENTHRNILSKLVAFPPPGPEPGS